MDRATIQARLTYWREVLGKLMDAYMALVDGGYKSYEIDDRSLTKLELPSLKKSINDAEAKVAQYEAMLNGLKPRKIVAVVPRDW
jgi:hypothetical protein